MAVIIKPASPRSDIVSDWRCFPFNGPALRAIVDVGSTVDRLHWSRSYNSRSCPSTASEEMFPTPVYTSQRTAIGIRVGTTPSSSSFAFTRSYLLLFNSVQDVVCRGPPLRLLSRWRHTNAPIDHLCNTEPWTDVRYVVCGVRQGIVFDHSLQRLTKQFSPKYQTSLKRRGPHSLGFVVFYILQFTRLIR